MNIGSRVKFVKKVLKTETVVPLGSIGVLCDISDIPTIGTLKERNESLTHYVVFNSIANADWFNVNELEYLGEV